MLRIYFLCLFVLFVVTGYAQNVTIPYAGQLAESGSVITGDRDLNFDVVDDIGTVLYSSGTVTIEFNEGHFFVELGAPGQNALPLALFAEGEARFLRITIEDGPGGPETLSPDIQFLPVPYALHAQVADTVLNLPPAEGNELGDGDSLKVYDQNGELRILLDPIGGSINLLDDDTIWYRKEVNSPPREVIKTNDGQIVRLTGLTAQTDEVFVDDGQGGLRKVRSITTDLRNPDLLPVGDILKETCEFDADGCKMKATQIVKSTVFINGEFQDSRNTVEIWYDCPAATETKRVKTDARGNETITTYENGVAKYEFTTGATRKEKDEDVATGKSIEKEVDPKAQKVTKTGEDTLVRKSSGGPVIIDDFTSDFGKITERFDTEKGTKVIGGAEDRRVTIGDGKVEIEAPKNGINTGIHLITNDASGSQGQFILTYDGDDTIRTVYEPKLNRQRILGNLLADSVLFKQFRLGNALSNDTPLTNITWPFNLQMGQQQFNLLPDGVIEFNQFSELKLTNEESPLFLVEMSDGTNTIKQSDDVSSGLRKVEGVQTVEYPAPIWSYRYGTKPIVFTLTSDSNEAQYQSLHKLVYVIDSTFNYGFENSTGDVLNMKVQPARGVEFDGANEMILKLRDRFGDQAIEGGAFFGAEDLDGDRKGVQLKTAQGDILIEEFTGSTWKLEGDSYRSRFVPKTRTDTPEIKIDFVLDTPRVVFGEIEQLILEPKDRFSAGVRAIAPDGKKIGVDLDAQNSKFTYRGSALQEYIIPTDAIDDIYRQIYQFQDGSSAGWTAGPNAMELDLPLELDHGGSVEGIWGTDTLLTKAILLEGLDVGLNVFGQGAFVDVSTDTLKPKSGHTLRVQGTVIVLEHLFGNELASRFLVVKDTAELNQVLVQSGLKSNGLIEAEGGVSFIGIPSVVADPGQNPAEVYKWDPGNPLVESKNDWFIEGNMQVQGDLQVAGVKNFSIDHPLDPYNKKLVHACIESDKALNMYTGRVETNADGEAWVTMPSYFEALNTEYNYNLTVIGSFAQAVVWEEIKDNRFLIKTSEPNTKVSWQVSATRNDAYMRDHPMQVEVDKQGDEKGQLMYSPKNARR